MRRVALALIVIFSALVPSARADGPVPGVVAGTGNDATLALLQGLDRFQALDPSILTVQLFFDPYRGDDFLGTGVRAAPFRSIAKMKEVCVSHVRCTVVGADRVFSPLTLRMTSISLGENYQRGETVTWSNGASSARVLDWSSADRILVLAQQSGLPPSSRTTSLVGQSSGASGDVRADQGIWNTVGGHVVYTFSPILVSPLSGTITISGHVYAHGEGPMRVFSSGALPGGVVAGVDYWICLASTSGFRLDDQPGCTSPLTSFTSSGTGRLGIAGVANGRVDDPIVPDCPDADRICVLIESEDPAHPATIDGNRFHVTGYDDRTVAGVFGANPDDGLAFASGDGRGWVGWQNIRVQNVATDAFSTRSANTGKLVVLNSPATDIRNGSENRTSNVATNNCYTTHGGGAMIVLNGGGSESRVDAATGSGTGACLAPTGATKFSVIGSGTFRSESVGAFASPTLATTGSDIVVLGHELLGASTGNSVVSLVASDSTTRAQLARVVLRASPTGGGSAFGILGGTKATTVRIFESTMFGAQGQYDEAIFVGDLPTAGLDFLAQGLLIDDFPLWLETLNRDTSFLWAKSFILDGYYDDDDTAGGDGVEFLFGATFPAPQTALQARARVRTYGGESWSLFLGRSFDSGGPGQGTAWGADTAQLRCQPTQACWGAYRARYRVPLTTIYGGNPNLSCIPADVLGERICALELRGRHIGARGAPDSDGDVLADSTEASVGTNAADPDSDDDLLEDGFEYRYGLNPLQPNASTLDPDADGLDQLAEQDLGTDPTDPDSDQDDLTDGFERRYGFDPLVLGETHLDSDGDYLDNLFEQSIGTNPLLVDTDGDGASDLEEHFGHSDPLDPNSLPVPGVPALGWTGLVVAAGLTAMTARRFVPRDAG